MANNQRGRNNNNPEGRNQYSNGWMDTAKDKPFTTAAAAAGAVAAGVFLWSKRNQISDQIGRLSDQITDWADDMRSSNPNRELAMTEGVNEPSASRSSRGTTGSRSNATRSTGATTGATRGQSPTSGQNINAGGGSTGDRTFNS